MFFFFPRNSRLDWAETFVLPCCNRTPYVWSTRKTLQKLLGQWVRAGGTTASKGSRENGNERWSWDVDDSSVNCVSAKGTRALLCCPCRAVGNAARAAAFFLCEFHYPHHFDVGTRVCNDRVALAWRYRTWRACYTNCNTSNFDVRHLVLLFTMILVAVIHK